MFNRKIRNLFPTVMIFLIFLCSGTVAGEPGRYAASERTIPAGTDSIPREKGKFPVLITKKPLARLQPVTESDIRIAWKTDKEIPRDALTDIKKISGRRAKTKIHQNTVLRAGMLEPEPLVKRGDIVTIVYESKFFRITALGKVRRKGMKGDRISVVNLDSNKRIFAVVTSSDSVSVK